MPKKKAAKPKTSKTEFMRFLDDHHQEVPGADRRFPKYHGHQNTPCRYGNWLRTKFPDDFNHLFHSFWLKHPELFGLIYEGVEEQLAKVDEQLVKEYRDLQS